jgi:response regulator NasT
VLTDLKIIVLELDPQRARDIIDALKDGGWSDVTMIGAAAQLDRFVRTQNPDIVLIDLANPDRDTLEHLSLVSAGIS